MAEASQRERCEPPKKATDVRDTARDVYSAHECQQVPTARTEDRRRTQCRHDAESPCPVLGLVCAHLEWHASGQHIGLGPQSAELMHSLVTELGLAGSWSGGVSAEVLQSFDVEIDGSHPTPSTMRTRVPARCRVSLLRYAGRRRADLPRNSAIGSRSAYRIVPHRLRIGKSSPVSSSHSSAR